MALSPLNACQSSALELLDGHENVFLTGVAGSGKSHLIRHYLRAKDTDECPVLASTGAAAILVGGRTLHSFFGLGVLQGGAEATIERALKNSRVVRRVKKIRGVVIDEVSMLSGETLRAAEAVCRLARGKSIPWGGVKVIAVGDFAQLPPVTLGGLPRDWAFKSSAWERSGFAPAVLRTIVRTKDSAFLEVLNRVRDGVVDEGVRAFLSERERAGRAPGEFDGTRLFPHRETTERYNLQRLGALEGEEEAFTTLYIGSEKHAEDLRKHAPIPEVLRLKEGALVMVRQNDPQGRWVNGSLGHVRRIRKEWLTVELHSGLEAELEPASFSLLDAEGHEVASARNFPVNLAYATTIHKAQGMTLDAVMADLRNLWEPGQAYVALSRARTAEGLRLAGWAPASIRVDPLVREFYGTLMR